MKPGLCASFLLVLAAWGCEDDTLPPPDAPIPIVTFDSGPADARPPDAPPPEGSSCEVAIDLSGNTSVVAGNTTLGKKLTSASCAEGAADAPEMYYMVEAPSTPVDLLADVVYPESAAPFDAVLSARTSCDDESSEIACVNEWWGERLEVLSASGKVFVVVDGTSESNGNRSGAFGITVRERKIVGMGKECDPAGIASRCLRGFRCVMGKCAAVTSETECADAESLDADLSDGSASVTATVLAVEEGFFKGACGAPAQRDHDYPEKVYVFNVPVSSELVASTESPETTYDTHVYLRKGACNGQEISCNDDVAPGSDNRSRLTVPALGPGKYYLFVDMTSESMLAHPAKTPRKLGLTVTLTPLPTPVDATPVDSMSTDAAVTDSAATDAPPDAAAVDSN
ncbi:MAG: PPC domain-containing protein [Deltaproteobacteria bacterium]|nr:PPC domain-containing protein [Deltaproteobacteria bacterium]